MYKDIEKEKEINPIRTIKSILLIKFNMKFKKKLKNVKRNEIDYDKLISLNWLFIFLAVIIN